MQLQADLAGLCVHRAGEVEATARGAAAIAGVGAGVLEDPGEAAGMAEPPQVFDPRYRSTHRLERLSAWRSAVQRVR